MSEREQKIDEVFSNASYMGVDEMRHLYYGRNDLYVKFTQSDAINKKGSPDVDTPYGLSVYDVRDVVGRRVNTKLLYAGVMRYRTQGSSFIDNIRLYSVSDYKKDVNKLRGFKYIDEARLDDAIQDIESNSSFGTSFELMWEVTKRMSGSGAKKGLVWRSILMDLGYTGFRDDHGSGLFAKKGEPVTFILDFTNAELFDIMPIQKYKTDPRKSMRRRIQLRNKYMWVKRNRIAKYPTSKYRLGNGMTTPNDLIKQRMGIVV